MAEDNGPQLIVESMKEAGVSFVTSLPDANLQKLLALVDADPELAHVTLAREEEGVGICAGAYMGGLMPVVIMQNGGFLNSCNALTTTALNFNIPILLLIYYAGDLGDEGFLCSARSPSRCLEDLEYAIGCCAVSTRSGLQSRAQPL